MNNKEKARAYDEALNWMRTIYPTLSGADKEDAEHFFPDRRDSEDERIRKSIIHILQVGGYMSPEEKDKVFAYLEKQKEQKSAQTDDEKEYIRTIKGIISDFIRDKKPEDVAYYQRIYDWLDGRHIEQEKEVKDPFDEEQFRRGYEAGKKDAEKEINTQLLHWRERVNEKMEKEAFPDYEIKAIADDIVSGLKASGDVRENIHNAMEQKPAEWVLPEDFEEAVYKVANFISPFDSQEELRKVSHRFAEQLLSLAKKELYKPAEWSEEDSDNLERVVNYLWMLDDYVGDDCAMPQGKTDKIRGNIQGILSPWIKSLPERFTLQPKQKWSEEDEMYLSQAIETLERENYLVLAEKLKSLRSKSHWKPSEEQMKALNALNCCGDLSYIGQQSQLISLYNDLKKL